MSARAKVARFQKHEKDRISDLPEPIISQILSSLPVKDVVRTCVLSKSWKYNWTSIHTVDIHDTDTKKEAFINAMNRILVFSSSIKNLSVSCLQYYDPSCMTLWISAALKHDIESLKMKYAKPGIVLPCSFFRGTSLRKLELTMPCTLKVWSHICFPNMKSLQLEGVKILNELPKFHTMKLSFPVMETLDLRDCKWLNVESVEIDAPALTELMAELPDDGRSNMYSIKIIGSSVQKFKTSGVAPENFILNRRGVLYAAFDFYSISDDYTNIGARALKQLNTFPNLEELEFSTIVAQEISLQERESIFLPNLRKLVLCGRLVMDISILLVLLHAAPSLKFLSIDMLRWCILDFDGHCDVPSCVTSHLEEVRIHNFGFKRDHELSLVKFLLKNGMQLKKFHISGTCNSKNDDIVEQLSMFPKCSTCSMFVVVRTT